MATLPNKVAITMNTQIQKGLRVSQRPATEKWLGVKLMGVAGAGSFAGNPLEQSGHHDEHAKSERLESEPKARDRKMARGEVDARR